MSITKLNQKDRIIEFPNRYRLNQIANQNNTYDLEPVTGSVEEIGTAFSKIYGDTIDSNFDELKNIVSYLKPTYERESESEEYIQNIIPTNVSPTWTSDNLSGNEITQDLSIYAMYNPKVTYRTTASNGFKTGYQHTSQAIAISSFPASSTRQYDSGWFLTNSKNVSKPSSYHTNEFALGSSNNTGIVLDIIYDIGTIGYATFNYQLNYANISDCKIYGSNDNNNWNLLTNIEKNLATTYTSNNPYRYYKFEFINNNTGSYNATITMYYLFISKIVLENGKNYYNIEFDSEFYENQRVLLNIDTSVETPTNYNTLNNIEIDTILEPSKYYELVYSETQDKFIAEEVRNAN